MGSHRVGHDWSDLAAAAASLNRPFTTALYKIRVYGIMDFLTHIVKWLTRNLARDFSGSQVVKIPLSHCRGHRFIRFLVEELRFRMLHGTAKKKKKKEAKREVPTMSERWCCCAGNWSPLSNRSHRVDFFPFPFLFLEAYGLSSGLSRGFRNQLCTHSSPWMSESPWHLWAFTVQTCTNFSTNYTSSSGSPNNSTLSWPPKIHLWGFPHVATKTWSSQIT